MCWPLMRASEMVGWPPFIFKQPSIFMLQKPHILLKFSFICFAYIYICMYVRMYVYVSSILWALLLVLHWDWRYLIRRTWFPQHRFCVLSVCGKYFYISQWKSLQKYSILIILAENFSLTVGQKLYTIHRQFMLAFDSQEGG